MLSKKNINNINMKEWYFINVTNVVTDHLKSQILNFDKHMQERVHKYAEKS